MVTPTICYDGKRHHWTTTFCRNAGAIDVRWSWCAKCGSQSEFRRDLDSNRWKRIEDPETGLPFMEVPEAVEP